MSFTTHIFVFYFLPTVLLVYYLLPGRRNLLRNGFLVLAGYVFYAWLNPLFVVIIFCATLSSYVLSNIMAGSENRRRKLSALAGAVLVNLGVLGFFKYFMFAQNSVNSVIAVFGAKAIPVLHVVLPVGVSFYTFKILSYLIDVYRSRSVPARSFFDFACYVSFFPQILSGPIQRYATIDSKSQQVPTFAQQLIGRTHSIEKFSFGAALFIIGFAKKVLLAGAAGRVADAVFAAEAPGTIDAWFGAAAYTFQLYFDFSAYSEMAIGLGLMFGFECPRNFNAPYLSDSFTQFWRRWHISLSSWFRDYLYIPLGGSRTGPARSYFNLVVVFLLCGLWHGANWTFIIWGTYHGLFLVIERSLRGKTLYWSLPGPMRVFLTFVLVTVGWVFFRSNTISEALRLLAIMFTASDAQGGSVLLAGQIYTQGRLIIMAICALLLFGPLQAFDWVKIITPLKAVVLIVLFCLSLMTMFGQSFSSFLYFKF